MKTELVQNGIFLINNYNDIEFTIVLHFIINIDQYYC